MVLITHCYHDLLGCFIDHFCDICFMLEIFNWFATLSSPVNGLESSEAYDPQLRVESDRVFFAVV